MLWALRSRLSEKSTMCASFRDDSESDEKGLRSRSLLVTARPCDCTASRDWHVTGMHHYWKNAFNELDMQDDEEYTIGIISFDMTMYPFP